MSEPQEYTAAPLPDAPRAHELAELGWEKWHAQEVNEALECYRLALDADPEEDLARVGMVTAVRARYPFYRFLFAVERLVHQLNHFSTIVFIALLVYWFHFRGRFAANKAVAQYLEWAAYVGVVFLIAMTVAEPVIHLLLRFNRYTRRLLTPSQVMASNWVGVVLVALVGCIVWVAIKPNMSAWIGLVVCAHLLTPTTHVFRAAPGWPRWVLAVFTSAIASAGIGAVILQVIREEKRRGPIIINGRLDELDVGFLACAAVFILGLYAQYILANTLSVASRFQRKNRV